MKRIIAGILVFFPIALYAAGEPNTYNNDFSINLPDRAEDLRDIPPLSNPGMFGSQLVAGVTSIPSIYSNRDVTYNEKGFEKFSYRPYGDTITATELLKAETVHTLAGTTLYFFNQSSRNLQVESADGKLSNFGMSVAVPSSNEPVYSYLFQQPGTYTVRNTLKPYQQVLIDVKDPREKDVCVIRETYTKEGVTQEKEFRAQWCDVPRDESAVIYPEDLVKKEKVYLSCIQVIAPARNKTTGEVKEFPTPCDVPDGWEALPFDYKQENSLPVEKQGTPLMLPKKLAHLKGRILLQVQSAGEAWYVHPKTGTRTLLGRPADAFTAMRKLGLGVSNNDLKRLFGTVPNNEKQLKIKDRAMAQKLAGTILLQVERNGEAYYLDPVTQIAYFLGRPSDAFQVMRNRGLGVTDENLFAVPFIGSSPANVLAANSFGFDVKNNHVRYLSPSGKQFDLGANAQAFVNAKKVATKVAMGDIVTIALSDELLLVPGEVDADNDGLSDFFETETLYAVLIDSKKKDSDDDGYDDKSELVSGYNPRGGEKIAIAAKGEKYQGELLLSLEDQMLWYINPAKKLVFLGTQNRFLDAVKKYSIRIPAKAPVGAVPKNDCGIVSTNSATFEVNMPGKSSAKTGDIKGKSALTCFNAAYRACKPATIILVANLLPLADIAIKFEIVGKQNANCKIKETALVDSTGSYKVGTPDACLYDMKKIKEFSVDKWPDHTQISCESDKVKKLAVANKCPLSVGAEHKGTVGGMISISVGGFKGEGASVSVRPKNTAIASVNGKPSTYQLDYNGKTENGFTYNFDAKKRGATDVEISDSVLKCSVKTKITVYDPMPKLKIVLPPGTKDCSKKGDDETTALNCFTEAFAQCIPAQMQFVSRLNSSTREELWGNTIIGLEDGKCKVIAESFENELGKDTVYNSRTCLYDHTKPIDDAFHDKSQCKGYVSDFTYGTLKW
ncbi:MAG: hypothetical protein Q8P56_03135 [Candidatus Uhrbacteria bacterium]|nr:hypothetical protein [Candidatus Uhrbacteria bacterium]